MQNYPYKVNKGFLYLRGYIRKTETFRRSLELVSNSGRLLKKRSFSPKNNSIFSIIMGSEDKKSDVLTFNELTLYVKMPIFVIV